MDIAKADISFPTLGLNRRKTEVFGVPNLAAITRPNIWLLPKMKGATLVDSRLHTFQVTKVRDLGPALPRWRDWFTNYKQVSLDIESTGQTSLADLKADLAVRLRANPRDWAYLPNDVGEALRRLDACLSLAEVIGAVASTDFVGARKYGASVEPPRPPNPPHTEPAVGSPVRASQANLVFPIVGMLRSGSPAAARNLTALTHVHGSVLRKEDPTGLEIIDANWRRYRVVQVHSLRTSVSAFLTRAAGMVVDVRWPLDYDLEPLAPGSPETTREWLLACLDGDPWRFTQDFYRDSHNRERARLKRAKTTAEFGASFTTSPFDRDYVTPRAERARQRAWKAEQAPGDKQAIKGVIVLNAFLIPIILLYVRYPDAIAVWLIVALGWTAAAFWFFSKNDRWWAQALLYPGMSACLVAGVGGALARIGGA